MSRATTQKMPPLPDGAVDMTPIAVSNWLDDSPVLLVRPDASVHQKVALAWSMAAELETMAEAARDADEDLVRSLCSILWQRSTSLKVLLETLGLQTADRRGMVEGQP